MWGRWQYRLASGRGVLVWSARPWFSFFFFFVGRDFYCPPGMCDVRAVFCSEMWLGRSFFFFFFFCFVRYLGSVLTYLFCTPREDDLYDLLPLQHYSPWSWSARRGRYFIDVHDLAHVTAWEPYNPLQFMIWIFQGICIFYLHDLYAWLMLPRGAVQPACSRTYFLGWICTIQILHSIS